MEKTLEWLGINSNCFSGGRCNFQHQVGSKYFGIAIDHKGAGISKLQIGIRHGFTRSALNIYAMSLFGYYGHLLRV